MQVGHHRLKTLTFFRKLLEERKRRVHVKGRLEESRAEEKYRIRDMRLEWHSEKNEGNERKKQFDMNQVRKAQQFCS